MAKNIVLGIGLGMLLLAPAGMALADMRQPDWASDPEALFLQFSYRSSALVSQPDAGSSPYGTAQSTVATGPFSDGWMDPANPFQIAGLDGAWDLGREGTIDLEVPAAPAGSGPVTMQVFVDVLAYRDIHQLPLLSFNGAVQSSSVTNELERVDPVFLGQWRHVLWQGEITFAGPLVGCTITADWNGSIVDEVAIYTLTVIPEPATGFLVALAAPLVFWARRWRRAVREADEAPAGAPDA